MTRTLCYTYITLMVFATTQTQASDPQHTISETDSQETEIGYNANIPGSPQTLLEAYAITEKLAQEHKVVPPQAKEAQVPKDYIFKNGRLYDKAEGEYQTYAASRDFTCYVDPRIEKLEPC